MENKKDLKSLFLVIFIIVSLVLAGFILYDKVLKKEEVKACSKTECQCEKCSNTAQCNCANNALGEKISSLKKITLTTTNQTVKIGNKEYKVRIDDKYYLLINDKYVYKDEFEVSVDANGHGGLYLTDKFMFITVPSQVHDHIEYAVDEIGTIEVVDNTYLQMKDFKIVDGYLHATGCFEEVDEKSNELYCEYKDVIIKYIDNTLIVTPYK